MNTTEGHPSPKTTTRQAVPGVTRTVLRIFLGGLIGLLLWLPLLDMVFQVLPQRESTEKRRLSQAPAFSWKTVTGFPKAFEGFFNDRFGGRNILIRLNNYLHVQWLGVSPVKSVLVGKEGWLFLTEGINDYRGKAALTKEQLDLILRAIQEKKVRLREKGIGLVILVAPSKHTIYPEYLPEGITRLNPKTRLDQILGYLGEEERAVMVDVRKDLMEGKKDRPVYSKTETHWNAFGAFLAYQKTIEHLVKRFPEVSPQAISDYVLSTEPSQGSGDLAVMLSLNGKLEDEEVKMKWKGDRSPQKPKIPKAVIFHDSFIDAIRSYLEPHFDQVIFQPWGSGGFEYALIEKEKPEVVIFEITERRLDALVK
ncbi:MAG: hypothetical protein AB1585_19280 [Thermodesulfobacteriota bacterium]